MTNDQSPITNDQISNVNAMASIRGGKGTCGDARKAGLGEGKMWGLRNGEPPDVAGENGENASIPLVLGPVEMLAKGKVGRHAHERYQNEAKVGRQWGKKPRKRPGRCMKEQWK